jgi:hypothetical protein
MRRRTVDEAAIAASTRSCTTESATVTIALIPAAPFRYSMSFWVRRLVAGTAIAPILWRARRRNQKLIPPLQDQHDGVALPDPEGNKVIRRPVRRLGEVGEAESPGITRIVAPYQGFFPRLFARVAIHHVEGEINPSGTLILKFFLRSS